MKVLRIYLIVFLFLNFQESRQFAPYWNQPHCKTPSSQWRKQDIPNGLSTQNSRTGNTDSPCSVFEKFLDDELLNMISSENNQYAESKGNHSFNVEPDKLYQDETCTGN